MSTGTAALDARHEMERSLRLALERVWSNVAGVANVRRLSGGASQETWAFDLEAGTHLHHLILRRAPGGSTNNKRDTAVPLATEAALIKLAEAQGVPVPPVKLVLEESDGLGDGFVMDRIEGETIARKILRDAEYAEARPKMARQCGEILARIHAVPRDTLPQIQTSPARSEIDKYRDIYKSMNHPHPVFELAFRYLEDNLPADETLTLVHGDFRNGNLMIGAEGVRAVLDWELAHVGDPMEDLGWICVNSWRFGEIDNPVGGFGSREDMYAGYEAAGGAPVDPERVKYWEVLGTLKWGIMCMIMVSAFSSGMARSVERAAIGRRSSETEIDLLNLLAPRKA
ncbi:MAG: phosphotransferase family protein [Candidatus Phaeomarinobacter sp.]